MARAWTYAFSISKDTISDLGNSACGQYGQLYVCSPLHDWMNASFILLGITQATGAILIYRNSRDSSAIKTLGFGFVALAGLGTVLVGLFPENTVSTLHILGAGLAFLIGNVGLMLLGLSLTMPRVLKVYTLVSGAVALTALLLLVTHSYLGLDNGGMERLTAYPQTIWLIVFGSYLLKVVSKESWTT